MTYYFNIQNNLGKLLCRIESDATVSGLWFHGQKYFPDLSEDIKIWDNENLLEVGQKDPSVLKVYTQLCQELIAYENGQNVSFTVPLKLKGSPFQEEIWAYLLEIPYGQTLSYGDLAKRCAAKRDKERFSAQAVGGAVGRNPISIIVPCHRVLGHQKQLTGYAGGLDKKRKLLEIEQMK